MRVPQYWSSTGLWWVCSHLSFAGEPTVGRYSFISATWRGIIICLHPFHHSFTVNDVLWACFFPLPPSFPLLPPLPLSFCLFFKLCCLGRFSATFPLLPFVKAAIPSCVTYLLQNGLPCLWWHTSGWEVPFILSALFCKAILAAIICPHMTSPINFNGLHNQVLTLFHPSLHFTFPLILVQTPGERHAMLCLGTSLCWLTLRTVLHLSRSILCPKQPQESHFAL